MTFQDSTHQNSPLRSSPTSGTVRRLLLLRHAKSAWGTEKIPDLERPLKPKGERSARLMGRFLSSIGHRPDRVLTSTAVRATQTAVHAAAAGRWRCPIERAAKLYDASPTAALHLLQETEDRHHIVLLSGHEPTMSELVLQLCGGRVSFPTSAVARIDLPLKPWRTQRLADGELAWLVTPKILLRAGFEKGE